MLRLPEFELRTPETVAEAVDLLDAYGSDAMVVAGGTDVYPKMKRRQFTPDVVVSLGAIDGIDDVVDEDDGGLRIGGLTSLATLAGDDRIQADYTAVAEAAGAVATPHHRRMGTVAGNLCQDTRCYYYDQNRDWRESLGWCRKAPDENGFPPDPESIDDVPCRTVPGSGRCWATFASDTAPPLIAYDAEVTIVGPDGPRVVALSDFYEDDGIAPHRLGDAEILTEVRLPPVSGGRGTYRKYSPRESFDFPSVGVAAVATLAPDGTVERVRVVLGAVSTHPVVVSAIPDLLEGEQPDDDRLDEAGLAAKRAARPMDNNDTPPAQRNHVAAVYTKRALGDVLGMNPE